MRQGLQGLQGAVEERNFVAGLQKRGERLGGQPLRIRAPIAGPAQQQAEDFLAQRGDVMGQARLGGDQAPAHGGDVRAVAVEGGGGRGPVIQPANQAPLGALNDRAHVPERVVQVEGD